VIQTVTDQLLQRLVRFPARPNDTAAVSRSQSQSPPITQSPSNGVLNGAHIPTSHPSTTSAWTGNVYDAQMNLFNGSHNPNGLDSSFPFENVDVYEPGDITAMPPPDWNLEGQDSAMGGFGNGLGMAPGFANNHYDWLSLSLNGLTNLAHSDINEVSNGQFGAEVNGLDLLDHIRLPWPQQNGGGSMLPQHPQNPQNQNLQNPNAQHQNPQNLPNPQNYPQRLWGPS